MPTWAPMFAFNVADDNTWRGSRLPEHCASKEDIQGGHPQQGVGKTKTYGCYYSNARLLYTATLVKTALRQRRSHACRDAAALRAPPGAGRSRGSR